MRYLQLGDKGVSVVGLGAWQFGSKGWGWGREFGEQEARQIVHRALELGINFIDTAEVYSNGASERLLGKALQGRGEQVFIATKVAPHHLLRRWVVSSAVASLRRLGLDAVELYQVHWPNPLVPIQWTMAAMRELQESGRVRQVGVSNFNLPRWQAAEGALGGPVVSNQVSYHLLDRGVERELLPYAQAQGRVIIAYSPLAQGLLAGRYTLDHLPRGVRLANPFFTRPNMRKAEPVVEMLREVAEAHGATPAQIALAWLLAHANVMVIPGAKSVAQVEANAAAADIQLSQAEMEALTKASDDFGHVGRFSSLPQMLRRLVVR